MSNELSGQRIAFLVANSGVEQVELTRPWQAVEAAGGEPVLIAPEKETVQAVNHDLELADTFDPAYAVANADATDFAGLVLPGGVANPDKLRLVPQAVAFVKDFAPRRIHHSARRRLRRQLTLLYQPSGQGRR